MRRRSTAGVLDKHEHIEPIADFLKTIEPMPAVFDDYYVKRLHGTHVKQTGTKTEAAEAIRHDIRDFKETQGCDRLVMIWCGSTEIFIEPGEAHANLENFEAALDTNDETIAPSMIYAYAALMEGVPFANGAPNLTVDTPALVTLANSQNVADLRQGLQDGADDDEDGDRADAEGAHAGHERLVLDEHPREPRRRGAGRPGELQDEGRVEARACWSTSFSRSYIRSCTANIFHKVRINYYPPRGDNKEGWDNIDIFGWLGYPMQIKIDFLCRDSILAAPLVLDLALFLDLAQRAGMSGIQEWLSFYFKSPQHTPAVYPEHDLFIQKTKLKNTLRWLMGEEQITHWAGVFRGRVGATAASAKLSVRRVLVKSSSATVVLMYAATLR